MSNLVSMYRVLLDFAQKHPSKIAQISAALSSLDQAGFLSKIQGYALAAVADHYRADLILDLGTGPGNSAAAFSIARPEARILTFDLEDNWSRPASEKFLPAGIGRNVEPCIGDLTTMDFEPLIGVCQSIVLFWDAHGYAVADHVLSHILPIIADRKHILVCHDMSHVRFLNELGYGGLPFWRGLASYGEWPGKTAYTVLGWTVTNVDQIIPILDFCARNQITFRSFDSDIHVETSPSDVSALAAVLDLPTMDAVHMGYFSMNETATRRFPSRFRLGDGVG